MYEQSYEDQFYNLAISGYRYELRRLVSVVNSNLFGDKLKLFVNKKKQLEMQRHHVYSKCLLNLSDQNGLSMDAENPDEKDFPFYLHVDLAAACAFFDGLTIPFSRLSYEQVDNYLHTLISQMEGSKQEISATIAERLNRSDTMRVVMALKLLGLLPVDSHRFRQLSLGALFGDRDRRFMHQQPVLAKKNTVIKAVGQGNLATSAMKFGTRSNIARDIVLVDLDPAVAEHYAELNRSQKGKVLALNCDVLEGLEKLYREIQKNSKKTRDLIMLFRMEPMMLPDVDLFFKKLAKG